MNHIFTVSQLNSYIHRIFESDYALRMIHIKGEISNCKYHSSGHIYFTLKDARSSQRCVMFLQNRAQGLDFRLENGQRVIVSGNVSVFERDGSYQLYARTITLAGAGLLYQRYEKLKAELAG
ncbi:MAG: exodeoxyribonuclease VII large subunit, partial [Eubacterium sp.]|nr:exodeoxyribonuclease VII large subunit [Eubacterium sp.]